MTVSCIVPVYNSGKYLKKCADSMLSQTVPPDELILVDDGSADESPGICDRYAEENDTVKVIHKENGGLISAWKAGVKASSADLLTFLDADDYVDPDYLENLLRGASDACDKQIVSCGGITESEDTGRRISELKNGLPEGVYEGESLDAIRRDLLGNEVRKVSLSRCMKLTSRSLILDNMDFADPKIRMGEDVSIMLPALLDSERVAIVPGAGYHYVKRKGSMVQAKDSGMYDQIKTLDRAIGRITKEKQMPDGDIQRKKEYVWLLMIAVRNALAGENRRQTVRDICVNEDTPGLIKETGVRARSLKGRLLMSVMENPSDLRIDLAGAVFR